MALLLERIGLGVGLAVDDDVFGLDFNSLACALALHQLAFGADAGARGDAAHQVVVELGQVDHNLQVGDDGAVVEGYEGHVLVAALGAHPSFDAYRCVYQRRHILFEQVFYFIMLHNIVLFFISFVQELRKFFPSKKLSTLSMADKMCSKRPLSLIDSLINQSFILVGLY